MVIFFVTLHEENYRTWNRVTKWGFLFWIQLKPSFSTSAKARFNHELKNNLTWWYGSSMPRAAKPNNSKQCCIITIQIHWQWKNRGKPGQQKVLLLHYSDSSQDQHIHHLDLEVKHTHLHCQELRVCHLVSSWSLYAQAVCAVERRHNYCQNLLNLSHIHSTEQDWQLDRVAISLQNKSHKWVHCFCSSDISLSN